MVRVEVRCPPPPRFPKSRSGTLVLDLHDIHLSTGGSPGGESPLKAHFADIDASRDVSHFSSWSVPNSLFLLGMGRIVVAHSLAGEGKAYSFVSLGPLSPAPISPGVATPRFGGMEPSQGDHNLSLAAISISVNKATPKPRQQKPATLIITMDIPSVHANLNKPLLDGLQYWVDDISQFMERIFGEKPKDSSSERGLSRNSSLLGSHYFATSSGGSEAEFSPESLGKSVSETVVKLSVSEGSSAFSPLRPWR